MKRMILVLCTVFFAAPFLYADTVLLKSGLTVTGEISEQTKDYVKIKVEGVDVTYWADEIGEIKTDASESQADASGMTPRQVYMAYAAALEKNDWQGMKKYLSQSYIQANQDKNGAPLSIAVRKFKTKDLKVLERTVNSSDARYLIIVYTAETSSEKERLFVHFLKQDGAWKIVNMQWRAGQSKRRSAGGQE